jgi:ribonuclease Z
MKLFFLGTAGSTPSKERNVSAAAVQMGARAILIDCGEGTQRQILHTTVSYMKITDIFITHFHGDHFLGLPALFQTMNLHERDSPLTVHGPTDADRFVSGILRIGYFRPRFPILVEEMGGGDSVELDLFTVTAADAQHNVPALSYSITEQGRPGKFNKPRALELGVPEGPLFGKLQNGESVEVDGSTITPDMVLGPPRSGRKVVFTGDTRPHPGLVELARDCDVLVHDATFSEEDVDKAGEFSHSTAAQAARTAKECGARTLFLTHFSPRYDEEEEGLLEEARAIFSETRMAHDLEEFTVSFSD